jgi:cell wall-associated NlpC family hydrolase
MRRGNGGVLVLALVLFLAAPHASAALDKAGLGEQLRRAVHAPRGLLDQLPTPGRQAGVPSPAAPRAVRFALGQLGDPYQWGAAGPDRWDCSGLTQAAYAHAGVRLPRTAAAQWRAGPRVPGPLARGDLVFFHTRRMPAGHAGHAGIYLGGGRMIEAPEPGQRVRVHPLRRVGYLGATRPTRPRPGR